MFEIYHCLSSFIRQRNTQNNKRQASSTKKKPTKRNQHTRRLDRHKRNHFLERNVEYVHFKVMMIGQKVLDFYYASKLLQAYQASLQTYCLVEMTYIKIALLYTLIFILYLLKTFVSAEQVFWHSSAHVLGEAMERVYGGSLCYGPPIDSGFYYDMFISDRQVSYQVLIDIYVYFRLCSFLS